MNFGEIKNEKQWQKMIDAENERASENKINIYQCSFCAREMVTVDSDNGTTPFQTSCPNCGMTSISKFYRVNQQATPTHEWYRPSFARFQTMSPNDKQHIGMGGLILRKIGELQ